MGLLTIIVAVTFFLIGCMAGALLFMRFSPEQKRSRDMEKHLHQAQDELKDYKLEVTQHFAETARLLKQMAESYRDVHNHLATAAENLSQDGRSVPIMKKLPEIDRLAADEEDDEQTAEVRPPLDYAPKASPYDRSTLNEDYDLEKVELEEKPIDDIAEAIAQSAKR